MDRALISWSWPNLITIPLMAFGGLLVAALLWTLVKGTVPKAGSANIAGTGY